MGNCNCFTVADDENVPANEDDVAVTGTVSEEVQVSGTHEFTIRQYSRAKGIGAGRSILSRNFPVDDREWFIRFYPDGYRAAESGFISFYLQTQYRPQLWSVRAEFAFQLLNPNGDTVYTRRCDKPCRYDRFCSSWGIRRFISREELEAANLGVIHGDSLTVRCTVHVIKKRKPRRAAPSRSGPVAVPVPPSCYAENAITFLRSGKAPFDVEFDVDGVIIAAHRMVVAAQSPWFEGLLYGHGSEAGSARVDINCTSPEAFQGVIHYIYYDELPDEAIDGDDAVAVTLQLFMAADMFLLERLKKMCAGRLCAFIKSDTVDSVLELAEWHSCKELEQACRNFLASPKTRGFWPFTI